MNRVRVYILSAFLLLLFCFLIYKLSDIQLISSESYGPNNVNLLQSSVDQRSSEISLASGRGMFVDRNKQPLNQYHEKDIVVFPFVEKTDLPSPILTSLNQLHPNWEQVLRKSEDAMYLSDLTDRPISTQLYQLIEQETIPGVIVVDRTVSDDQTIASHLLGLVRSNPEEFAERYKNEENKYESQPIGISGLEKAFDPFLISENEQKLLYHVDGKGDPLLGLELRYQGRQDQFYPVKIQTTIDSSIQEMTESVVDNHNITKGGLVLLDVDSSEVIAMISRPHVNEKNPYQHDSVTNQMLTTQFPGSIFKLVVAAAAIEHGKDVIEQSFDCDINLYGDEPASRQLGELTFSESFAQSCNYTFGLIAQALMNENREILVEYSKKLGLLGPVGWTGDVFHYDNFSQLPEEQQGIIWGNEQDKYVEDAIIQTAIGQKEVKVTPLAVANMIATIVNNGIKKQVKVVDEILYNNDTTMTEFKSNTELDNRIKKETALELKKLMEKVVTSGTGNSFKGFRVAGKTGTAETGRENHLNHWFAGYFPKENPKYAMVVVDLNQSSQEANHLEVYQEIVANLT